jgi:hypothetical protein
MPNRECILIRGRWQVVFLIYAAPTGLHKLTAITYIFSLP